MFFVFVFFIIPSDLPIIGKSFKINFFQRFNLLHTLDLKIWGKWIKFIMLRKPRKVKWLIKYSSPSMIIKINGLKKTIICQKTSKTWLNNTYSFFFHVTNFKRQNFTSTRFQKFFRWFLKIFVLYWSMENEVVSLDLNRIRKSLKFFPHRKHSSFSRLWYPP